jgi:hypothetical protein
MLHSIKLVRAISLRDGRAKAVQRRLQPRQASRCEASDSRVTSGRADGRAGGQVRREVGSQRECM